MFKVIVFSTLVMCINLFALECDAIKLKKSLIDSREKKLSWKEVHLKTKECYQYQNVIDVLGEYWFRYGIKQNKQIVSTNLNQIRAKSPKVNIDKVKLIIPDETENKFPELTEKILATKSMDNEERNYWLDLLPTMTEEQVSEIENILDTEQKKLVKIDKRYSKKNELDKKKIYFPEYINKSSKFTIIQKTLKKKINDTTQLVIPNKTKKVFSKLVDKLISSESMDNKERNYWFQALLVMTKEQVDELRDILDNERKKLLEIEKKYSTKTYNGFQAPTIKLIKLMEQPTEDGYKKCFVPEDINLTIIKASNKTDWVYAIYNRGCKGYLNLRDINITDIKQAIYFLSYESGSTVLSLLKEKQKEIESFSNKIKMSIARAYILDNQANKSISILKKTHEQNSSNQEALSLLATAYSQIDKLNKSIFYQKKLVDINSSNKHIYKLNVYQYLNNENKNVIRQIDHQNFIESLFYKIYTLQVTYEKSKKFQKTIKNSLYKNLLDDKFSKWYQQYVLALLSQQDPINLLPEEYQPKNGGIYSKTYWASGIVAINKNNYFAKKMLLKAKKYTDKEGRGRIDIERLLIKRALSTLKSGDPIIQNTSRLCPKEYDSCHAFLISTTDKWAIPTNKLYETLLMNNFEVTKIQNYDDIASTYQHIKSSIPLNKNNKSLLIIYFSTPILRPNNNLMFCLNPNENIPEILSKKVCISSDKLLQDLDSKNIDYKIIVENQIGNISLKNQDHISFMSGNQLVIDILNSQEDINNILKKKR